ncbi:Ig-like domain-containing protein [Eubacterium sp. An3]|uniref:Ig-like domain-containing protein n=1 Tax=Eubacterium sp. An3 TaxID=1965628 RepID=UPI000B3AD402|nr:Ig-like domain-containing protein [Eubacterium sp. An3]OUO26097.1 hypothetical protein B5F87_15395 [Eubacterium sp. An3]
MKKLLVWILLCAMLVTDIPARAAVENNNDVYYISTAEELVKILEATRGKGYFELTEDIDLSGYDWEPLFLAGTFNGNGYALRNVTITGAAKGSSYVGLFYNWGLTPGAEGYVTNLTLTNIKIDVNVLEGKQYETAYVGPFAGNVGSINNCTVSGSVTVTGGENMPVDGRIEMTGLKNASNCRVDLDMRYEGGETGLSTVYVTAMSACTNCQYEGDVKAIDDTDSVRIYAKAAEASRGCSFIGNVETDGYAYGMEGVDCYMKGDISSISSDGAYAWGTGGIGNLLEGDVTARGVNSAKAYGVYEAATETGGANYPVHEAKDCQVRGNITASETGDFFVDEYDIITVAYGVYSTSADNNVTGCYVWGDVSASSENHHAQAAGLYLCSESYFQGNVTAKGNREGDPYSTRTLASGNYGGKDNYAAGDIAAWNPSGAAEANGSTGGENCFVEGDVSASGMNVYAYGLEGIVRDSFYYGDVRTEGKEESRASLIQSAQDSYAAGDVYAKSNEVARADGICPVNTSGNNAVGNITAEGGKPSSSYGSNGDGGSFSGTVTSIYDGRTISAGEPGAAQYFIEDRYDKIYISDTIPENMYYDKVVGRAVYGQGGSVTEPEEWGPEGGEDDRKDTYSLRIMDARIDKPVTDATVNVDGTEYQTDKNGMITVTGSRYIKGLQVVQGGSIVHTQSRIYAKEGRTKNIYVNGLKMDLQDLNLGESGETTVTGPEINIKGKSFPLFELPFSFEMDLVESMRIAYDDENRVYQVILDSEPDDEEEDGIADAADSFWLGDYQRIKRQCENIYRDFREKSFSGLNRSFGIDSSVDASGYLEFRVTKDGLELQDGKLVFVVAGSFAASRPIPPAPYIFLTFGIETGFQAESTLTLEKAVYIDPQISAEADISFSLTPSVGVGAGLDKILSAEVGIEGPLNANLNLPFRRMEENAKLTLASRIYLQLTALSFRMRFSKTFADVQLYPKEEEDDSGLQTFASIPDDGAMELIDRSYLRKASARSSERNTAGGDTVKDLVYPYGNAQTITLSGSTKLMVWLDDDQSRNLANKTALYYSILRDGEWSEPAQVENDGTPDFDFSLCRAGSGAALVWQDAKEQVAENVTEEELAKKVELSYIEYDGGEFQEVISLTEGESYEYSPKLYSTYSDRYVIWTQNDSDSILPGTDDTAESIYFAHIGYDGRSYQKQETKVVAEGISSLYETAVGESGLVAWLTGSDMNPDNEGARKLSVKEMSGQERTEEYEQNTCLSSLQLNGSQVFFSEEGSIKYLSMEEDPTLIVEDQGMGDAPVRLLFRENTDNYLPLAVVYEVQDGFTSNLYASYPGSGGTYTNPVPVTDWDEKIRAWSILEGMDDTMEIGALLADIQVGETENDMSETARLVWTTANPQEDIILTEVFTEDDHISRGSTATFLLNVENHTKENLKNLTIKIAGADGSSFYEGETAAFVKAGGINTIAMNVPVPADFQQQELTFTVTGGAEEADMENNSRTFLAGAANLSLELTDRHLHDGGYLEAVITNNGSADASGVDLKITGEDGAIIYEGTAGNVLAGGEKRVTIPIADGKRTFNDDTDSYGIVAEVSHDGEESTKIDNEIMFRIRPPRVSQIAISERTLTMTPGEAYQPSVQVYPSNALNKEYRVCSDNEAVVTVEENGTIRAVSEGTADIIFMAVNSSAAARVSVTVSSVSDTGTIHKILLDAGDGTVSPQRLEVQDGQTAVLPCPMQEGYYFVGWYNAPEAGNEITSETAITQDMTLYARWTDTRPSNPELPDPDTPDPDDPDPDNPDPDNPDPDAPDPDDPDPDTPDPDTPDPDTPDPDNPEPDTPNPGTPSVPGNTQAPQTGNGAGTGQAGSQTPQAAARYRIGDVLSSNGLRYRVTDAGQTQGQVQLIGTTGAVRKNLVIPAEIASLSTGQRFRVTAIGNNAFKNQKKLRKVTIGKNVSAIGKRAFFNCKKLKTITIKSKMLTKKTVGAKAFRGIYARASVKVPKKKRTLYRKILRAKGAGAQVRIR